MVTPRACAGGEYAASDSAGLKRTASKQQDGVRQSAHGSIAFVQHWNEWGAHMQDQQVPARQQGSRALMLQGTVQVTEGGC